MKRSLIVIVVAFAVAGAVLVGGAPVESTGESVGGWVGSDPATVVYAGVGSEDPEKARALTEAERLSEELKVRPETRKVLGRFPLPQGGEVTLEIARTRGAQSCVIDTSPSGVEGRSCSDTRFFDDEHVVWSITGDGGPERFAELYVSGIAGPGVARVVILRSDGTTAEASLNRERAFVVAGTADELARDAVPAGIRAYGRGGKLLESVDIPRVR